jgi:hypothetical protein
LPLRAPRSGAQRRAPGCQRARGGRVASRSSHRGTFARPQPNVPCGVPRELARADLAVQFLHDGLNLVARDGRDWTAGQRREHVVLESARVVPRRRIAPRLARLDPALAPILHRVGRQCWRWGLPSLRGQDTAVRVLLGLRRRRVLPSVCLDVAERLFDRETVQDAVAEPEAAAVVDGAIRALDCVPSEPSSGHAPARATACGAQFV